MDFTLSLLRGLFGITILLGFCYLLSADKKKVNWRLVGSGMLLQIGLAILMLKVPFARAFFQLIVDFFVAMVAASEESAVFLFGDLAKGGGPFGFAFSVLPHGHILFSDIKRFILPGNLAKSGLCIC